MKNALYLVTFIFLLTACSKEEAPASDPNSNNGDPNVPVLPLVSLISGSEEVNMGVIGAPGFGSINYTIQGTAADGFVSLEIQRVENGVATEYETIAAGHPNFVAGNNIQTYDLGYVFTEDDLDIDLSFRAIITDANNNTATLNFGHSVVRRPMSQKNVTVQTVLPPNGDITIPYYLFVRDGSVLSVSHSEAVDVDLDQNVAMVFSVNNELGYYLSSLTAVTETVLVNGIQEKSTTRFKDSNSVFTDALADSYNIYDVFDIMDAYDALEFNSHQQKAANVSEEGKRFFFKTDQGDFGVLQVVSFTTNGDDAYLELDVFVTQ